MGAHCSMDWGKGECTNKIHRRGPGSGAKEYINHGGGFKKDVPFLQEVVVMEGVAHFINQEKADEISKHIYDFIKNY